MCPLACEEQDILVQTLEHLITWIDTLIILDTGNTDGSVEILESFASRDKRIVLWRYEPLLYTQVIRSVLFNRYYDRFEQVDRVELLDGDESFHVSPPQFVADRLRRNATVIHLKCYFFRLRRSELNKYDSGAINILKERCLPIENRRRFYKASNYAEPRFFRYRRSMQWPPATSFPFNAGFVARERVPIRHYPHRDPLQIEARFRLRAEMMQRNARRPGHWKLRDWRDCIQRRCGAPDV